MLLSIVIPVYNVEKYLSQCLDSIVKQIENCVEVLLIDDGSNDGSAEICDLYEQKYSFIKSIHKKNGGVSDARNLGINEARGKYIFFVDSDDWIAENAIKNIMKILESDPDVDVVIGSNFDFYEGKKEKKVKCVNRFSDLMIQSKTGEKLLCYLLSQGTYDWYTFLHIVRKSFILQYSFYFDTQMVFGEDAIWLPQVLLNSKKNRYIETPIYFYRRNRKGAATQLTDFKSYYNKLMVCMITAEFCKRNNFCKATTELLMGNLNRPYTALLADAWIYPKQKRKQILKQAKRFMIIFRRSPRKYHKFIYYVSKIIGIYGVSWILHQRANYVRRKVLEV